MRIVEYQKDTTSLNYRVLQGLGIVAGIFSLIVCALMIANNLSIKKTDPIHSPALLQLKNDLNTDRNNEALREEIRELDLLTRRAFFTSQRFNRMAIYMLVGGLVVMIVSFKTLEAYKAKFPYPDGRDPKDDLIENANWARKSVTYAGLVMVGFALILSLPWQTTLDENAVAALAEGEESPEVNEVVPAPPPPVVVASREEMLQNWPSLRGAADGIVQAENVPTDWDGEKGTGVIWKKEIPLPGFSSPIIWKDRLFLSGGDREKRQVYCYSVENGDLLWTYDVTGIQGSPAEAPKVSADTGYAAATMTTDGSRVFAIFSTGDIVALDFEGQKVWDRNLGVPENPYGHGSSLELHNDVLLVQYDQEKHSFVAGLDITTGKDRWKADRKFGPSWASPMLLRADGANEVVLSADPKVVSYDPATGKELWSVECLKGGEVAPTPVFAEGKIFVACDYVAVVAIDATTHKVLWRNEDLIPGVSTPIITNGLMFGGLNDGGMFCIDTKTGEEIWYEDTDDGFYASPLLVGEKVYLLDRMGVTHIFEVNKEFKSVADRPLGEESVCTPAILNGSIYFRGTKHLFRIGT